MLDQFATELLVLDFFYDWLSDCGLFIAPCHQQEPLLKFMVLHEHLTELGIRAHEACTSSHPRDKALLTSILFCLVDLLLEVLAEFLLVIFLLLFIRTARLNHWCLTGSTRRDNACATAGLTLNLRFSMVLALLSKHFELLGVKDSSSR